LTLSWGEIDGETERRGNAGWNWEC
jgi:hypothetical protein